MLEIKKTKHMKTTNKSKYWDEHLFGSCIFAIKGKFFKRRREGSGRITPLSELSSKQRPHISIMDIQPIPWKLHCKCSGFSAYYFFIATSSNTAAFILCYVLGSCVSSVLISLDFSNYMWKCWFDYRHFLFHRKIPNILFRNE